MVKNLFQKKIEYLFAQLKIDEKEFVYLFLEDEKKLNSRKKTVIDKWLKGEMKESPKDLSFKFNKYKISKYEVNSEQAFTKDSFLSDSFESFKMRVDNYIANKDKPIELLEYKYIYYYYKKKNKIVHATLNTLKKINSNKYEVELIPPSSKANVQTYRGYLEINNERYYISVRNDIEILTLYFVLGRGYADNSKVYGIGLGISNQKGLVEATKELLSKRKLTKEEEDELYLSLNESEYLLADEIEYIDSIKKNYLKKINIKLNSLTTFVNTSKDSLLLQNKVNTDPYLNIFFRNLIDTNEISKKIILEQYYFTVRRRTALKAFLKSISNRETSVAKMVYPVFEEDSVLFDKEDEVSVKLLNIISYLSKNGLDLTIIFVIDTKFSIEENFKKEIKKLINNGVKIKIVLLEDIQKLKLSSYDFLYSKEEELVAIYTSVRDRIRIYKVTTMKDRIRNLIDDFKKIERKSFDLDKFVEKRSLSNNSILESLVGSWNWYFYSSMEEDEKVEIWNFIVKIKSNGEVYFYNEKYNDLNFKGIIDTTYTENQSFIKASAKKSKNLSLIFIENRDIHKHIFKVSSLDKQRGIHRNMASFGIFSKVRLWEDEVIEVLGKNIEETRLMEEENFSKRVNLLDMKARKKKMDKS